MGGIIVFYKMPPIFKHISNSIQIPNFYFTNDEMWQEKIKSASLSIRSSSNKNSYSFKKTEYISLDESSLFKMDQESFLFIQKL